MAVLLLAKEPYHRSAIHRLLREELGFRRVFETCSSEHARELANEHASSIRLAVVEFDGHVGADFEEGRHALEMFRDNPELRAVPIVAISETAVPEIPRADAVLRRPFHVRALAQAVRLAMTRRSRCRDTILIASRDTEWAYQRFDWCKIVRVIDREALYLTLSTHAREIGSLLIDTRELTWIDPRWLNTFHKTSGGCGVELVALADAPEQLQDLRTFVQRTHPLPTTQMIREAVLTETVDRLEHRLEILHGLVRMKSQIQRGSASEAVTLARLVLELDAGNTEALCVLGEHNESRGRLAEAENYYRDAIESNLCCPKGHVHLLRILTTFRQPKRFSEALLRARSYCPGEQEIKAFTSYNRQTDIHIPLKNTA